MTTGLVGCLVVISGVGSVIGSLCGGGVGSNEAASTPSDAAELIRNNFPAVAGDIFCFLLQVPVALTMSVVKSVNHDLLFLAGFLPIFIA